MLNYIWLTLIVVGILVAVGTDWHDLSTNRYQNGAPEEITILLDALAPPPLSPGTLYRCTVVPSVPTTTGSPFTPSPPQRAEYIPSSDAGGVLHIFIDDHAPALWKERKEGLSNHDYLSARVSGGVVEHGKIRGAKAEFDKVQFVRMKAVTNDGIIAYAKTAVELAIGLIGIMALWLGIMKIAEQAGLVASLARLLKPLTRILFPDVPADHPAMGAMIMNMAANMLGLANAATPLGLKAMEELNKLNPRAGTASDAMCTFLVINTSNLQLIPATVIALRAAAGSSNPAEILGAVLLTTFITVTFGVVVVKLLARLSIFRRQLAV